MEELSPELGPYGVFNVVATEADRVKKVVGMVEKTAVEDAQSDLVATGGYSVDRAIFDVLRRIESGARGELQFAGTINLFFYEGYSVHVVVHDGIRPDLGNPAGFITVNAEIGLRYHKYGSVLFADLEALLEKYRGESG